MSNLPKEVLKLIEKKSLDMIKDSISRSSIIDIDYFNFSSNVQPGDKWIADLVDSILDASNALEKAFLFDPTFKNNLKISFKHYDEATSAILKITGLNDKDTQILKTFFYGGEIKKEENGEILYIDGTTSFNKQLVKDAGDRMVDSFIKRFEKDDDVKKLIEKYTKKEQE